jgi:hypothetical protein
VWTQVYEAWAKLPSALLQGYQSHGFAVWTLPCLYVVCKHLRIFAIKADDERNNNSSLDDTVAESFQDDFDPDTNKRQKLEDCARILSRVFMVCQNDR